MRDWTGIQLDTAATDPGAVFATNPSFFTKGELARRHGMVAFTAQSGTALANFQNQMTGQFVVFATNTGTVEAVAAP